MNDGLKQDFERILAQIKENPRHIHRWRERQRQRRLKAMGLTQQQYDQLTPEDMVVMDLDGNKIEGSYRPSSDTATHLELYRAFPKIGGISGRAVPAVNPDGLLREVHDILPVAV